MPLILHDLTPMHWALAALGIASVTLILAFVYNRRLGLSSGFEDVCSLAVPLPYFKRSPLVADRSWRLPMMIGLLVGGVVSAWLGGGWQPIWDVGMLDDRLALGTGGKLIWMFAGGLFIGFGTRLGGGCTSGHGIFGLSNLEWPSLVTTLIFMGAGMATTNLIYRVWLP
jgi:uncharacterized membrane protein YedE/YeeE